MTRLSNAEEAITETLFNVRVINEMHDKNEHFLGQESFRPAKKFPEQSTRFRNYDDSREAGCRERTGHGHIDMQAEGKKGVSGSRCYVCRQQRHRARKGKPKKDSGQSSARGSGSNEASWPEAKKTRVLQVWDIMQGSACRGGQSVTASMKGDEFIIDKCGTDHMLRYRAVFSSFESWNERKTVENPKGTLLGI